MAVDYNTNKKIVNKETILFSLQNHPFPILLSKLIKRKIIISDLKNS